MSNKTRLTLLALTAALAIAAPIGSFVAAQTAQNSVSITSPALESAKASSNDSDNDSDDENDSNKNSHDNNSDKSFVGSIKVPAKQSGVNMTDAQEKALLPSLAKITLAQAQTAALAAVPGTVSSVKLSDENGYVVYEVVIGKTTVYIDAGDAKVLYQGLEDGE